MSKLFFQVLPSGTRKLFDALSAIETASAFTLIGGTAAALHLGHRISRDLDFATTEVQLDRARIDEIVRQLRRDHGAEVTLSQDAAAEAEFADQVHELADFQQDYSVRVPGCDEKAKLTFFSPDHRKVLGLEPPAVEGALRIASLRTIGYLKAAVLPQRCAARDLFDLYSILKTKSFSAGDIGRALAQTAQGASLNHVLDVKLPRAGKDPGDPGFSAIGSPPSLDEMRQQILALRSQVITGASQALKESLDPK